MSAKPSHKSPRPLTWPELFAIGLGCALVATGFAYLRLGEVTTGLRVAVLIASIAITAAVVWLVARNGE